MLYIVTYIIESRHKKLTFVVTDALHIDGMKAFSVDKVTFILARSNNANLRPIDATNYSREQSVGHFMNMLCLADNSWETSWTARETVDLSTPTVSPMTWRKLPLA